MGATRRMGIGIIGCGNISSQYLKAMRDFPVREIIAVADMKPRREDRNGVVRSMPFILREPPTFFAL